MEKTIISLFVLILLIFLVLWVHTYYMSKKIDSRLEKFYKVIDVVRNDIHQASSLSEIREIITVDIEYLKDVYRDDVSKVVLDKELDLLESLAFKKSKKLK